MTIAGERGAAARVALVETAEALPGLLPFQSWDVLGLAERILVRDVDRHPFTPHLHLAGLDLQAVEPATLGREDLDLNRPGAPEDRRIAKSLVGLATGGTEVVYLLGPDDDGLAPALAGMAAAHDLEIELVFLAQQPEGTELLRLVDVMRRLRDPADGCPWDLEQDHASLTRYLVEETYELVDAIERADDVDLAEELGDVLLQVVFHARIGTDRRAFGIDEVARGIADKLVRRHPHVFADGDASTPDEVQASWDALKAEEKRRTGPFDGVPAAGPGLDLLTTLQRKAAKQGWGPPTASAGRGDLVAAIDRAQASDDLVEREEAIGAAVAALVAVARDLEVDPEAAARTAARAFRGAIESGADGGDAGS
ncbi:MAG: MazG family protein [Nitriliruptoraceae bacterium]|nr:MazG family protein [Nitriliruptoraceae bacterium]